MTTAATSLLGLALPVTGELSGTWGDTVNNSITSLLDSAIAGTTTLSTDGDVTLSTTTLASNQARQAILLCSGARTAIRTITAPAQSKIYTVINSTTGGYAVKIVGVGPTTGVTIGSGQSAQVAWNGSDFVQVGASAGGSNTQVQYNNSGALAGSANMTFDGTTLTAAGLAGPHNGSVGATTPSTGAFTTLSASSTVTLSGGTANGVAYLNGSKVVTTGSALTFDGTNFGVNSSSTIDGGRFSLAFSGSTQNGIGLKDTADASGASFWGAYNSTGGFIGSLRRSGTDNALAINGNSYLAFQQSGSEQMRLTSTGLGIGTSSLYAKLTSKGTGGGATSTYKGIINAYNADVDVGLSIGGYNATPYAMYIQALDPRTGFSATYPLSLNPDGGNVGIGTSSPAVKLDVAGAINATAQITVNTADGANQLRFQTAGVTKWVNYTVSDSLRWYNTADRMTLDSSGNLGLGVTPSAWSNSGTTWRAIQAGSGSNFVGRGDVVQTQILTNAYYNGTNYIYQNSTTATQYYQYQGTHAWGTAASGTAGNAITWTQAMTLDASGNLGIGTTSPGAGMRVDITMQSGYEGYAGLRVRGPSSNNTFAGGIDWISNDGTTVVNKIGNSTSGMLFYTANTERARIDSNGNFMIATTTAGAGIGWSPKLTVDASGTFGPLFKTNSAGFEALDLWNSATSGTRYQVYFRDGTGGGARGSITTDGTNTAFNTSSDYRLKDNPQPLTGSGAFIDALKPKTWVWKETGVQGVGFIAHEVQEVSPGSVVGEKDGEQMQQMEYGSAEFIANIIAELQSLRARVAQLEAK